MNKTAIKNFAIWARNKLIADITYKAGLLGITDKEIKAHLPQSTKDVQFFDIGTKEPYSLSGEEIKQRDKLVELIRSKSIQSDYITAYKSVVEEVAYTWFNRLIAIRFMEVNDYLPSRIRVLSSESKTKIEPDLVTRPFESDLEFTPFEKDRIVQLTQENKLDELFRMLFIKQCNKLNEALPDLFEKTADYTELLLTISFTDSDGIVNHLVSDIAEEDFNIIELNEEGKPNGQVEILGWLYQHYISEPKNILINAKKPYKKADIPFVTQIFTSDWIVKYIVDNSLGRYWIERNPDSKLKEKLEFFVAPKSGEIEFIDEKVSPEKITFFDPCMGSGHILIYAFDVLMEIYKECGYSERDAAQSIICNNLFGVDIDERAYQYAYFALMMIARSYDRRFLSRELIPNLAIVEESNDIKQHSFEGITYDQQQDKIGEYLCNAFLDAKEVGSLLSIHDNNYKEYLEYLNKCKMTGQMTIDSDLWNKNTLPILKKFAKQADIMCKKYTIVCTNPPYMPNNKMSTKLKNYIENNYFDYRSDSFSVFIIRCLEYCLQSGYIGMLTPFVWMFISSYEKLRGKLLQESNISTLVQLEYNAFESACVPVCSFVLENVKFQKPGEYINLSNFKGSDLQAPKTIEAINDINCIYRFSTVQEKYYKIDGLPIAYWVSDNVLLSYEKGVQLGGISAPRKGNSTSNNEKFLRLWFEVEYNKSNYNCSKIIREETLSKRWFPYNKGGGYRKWYGNNEYLIDWYDDAAEIRSIKTAVIANYQYFMKSGLTWSTVSSSNFSIRYFSEGFIFDNGGCCIFDVGNNSEYLLSLLNSKVFKYIFGSINQTLNFQSGEVAKFPVILENSDIIKKNVIENINISKSDWDSFETSWDFKHHPLLNGSCSIRLAYESWVKECKNKFLQLKFNEEELNSIFIDIYGLQNEVNQSVEDKDITLKTNTAYRYKQKRKKIIENEFEVDEEEDEIVEAKEIRDQKFMHDTVCEFISYAIGCMFGRYSLDVDGLAFAGADWDDSKYHSFIPDKDNIIPICDEQYLDDDVTGKFIDFVRTVYGEETLEENLVFIADAIGGKGSARENIRNYFINDFFANHTNTYTSRGAGKRPIYWLFDSGKNNGFKALIYMHRYDVNTIGNLRIDYLHRMQRIYDSEINRMQETIDNSADGREVATAQKRKEKLIKQLKETKEYDEKIAHLALSRISIDLDDGVKVNYEKVQIDNDGKKLNVLAKI